MYSSAIRSSSSIEMPGSSRSPISSSVSATISPARAMPSISAWLFRMIIRSLSSNRDLLQRLLDLGEHLVHRSVRTDPDEDSLHAVVFDQGLRLAVVQLEPRADRRGRVVDATFRGGTLRQPADAGLVRDLQLEHDRQLPPDLAQHRVQRLRLRHRTREAVEDEPVPRVVFVEP